MLYFGTVEDRNDPQEIGRVRVRVFGLHSSDKINDIPTSSLPWAPVMNPTTTPGNSGLGQTPFLVPGSWVVLSFLDEDMQSPIVMGSVHGLPYAKPNSENGFADPTATFPREVNESSIPRRARGTSNIVKQVAGTEPADPYNAKYPYNHVFSSESGHMIEMDDTPNHERVHVYHRSGSYVEIHPDGSMVVHSSNHYNSSQKLEINVTNNADINVGGNINVKAGGTLDIHSSGNIKMSSVGSIDIAAGTTFKASSAGEMDLFGSLINLKKPGVVATSPSYVASTTANATLVTPLNSVVEPDGNSSYSTQTAAGVTVPRKDQSSLATTFKPVIPEWLQ
jgi:hypothetical protein|tara:strand:- start:409 stop:1416 length:1008 start_codon:yes stop_codon:yes gene_type:complete